MSALPYMPLWVGDYIADTQHLTAAEHGAYMLLIMAYWQRGRALPDDSERLAIIARMTPTEWAKAEPTLREFFKADDGEWRHSRIEAELAKVRDKSAKASASAKRRHSDGNADAQRTQSERTSERSATQTHTQIREETNLLPPEQEAAREKVKGNFFDLSGVGVGLGQGEITAEAKLAVAKALNIADATPLVEAYWRWPQSRKSKSVDAHFRSFALSKFARWGPAERAACQPLSAEPEIKLPPVAASPQLVALLNRSARHAH